MDATVRLGHQKRRADIERFQRDVAAGKTAADARTKPRGRAIVRGGKGTAARVVAVRGAVFTFAAQRDLRTDNPVRGVKLYKGEKKERFLSAAELIRLGDALSTTQRDGASPIGSEIPRIEGNAYVLPGLEGRHFGDVCCMVRVDW